MLLQLLTAEEMVSLEGVMVGGGAVEWWMRLSFIFGDIFILFNPSILLFKHNFMLQPYMFFWCWEHAIYTYDHHLTLSNDFQIPV